MPSAFDQLSYVDQRLTGLQRHAVHGHESYFFNVSTTAIPAVKTLSVFAPLELSRAGVLSSS